MAKYILFLSITVFKELGRGAYTLPLSQLEQMKLDFKNEIKNKPYLKNLEMEALETICGAHTINTKNLENKKNLVKFVKDLDPPTLLKNLMEKIKTLLLKQML